MAERISGLAEVAYNGRIVHIEARLHEGLPISPSDVLWLINQLRERDLQLDDVLWLINQLRERDLQRDAQLRETRTRLEASRDLGRAHWGPDPTMTAD